MGRQSSNQTPTTMADTPSMTTKAKTYIIDLVNPKFKSLSRPLLVALTVGSLTLVITIALYTVMMEQRSTLSLSTQQSEIEKDLEKIKPICIHDMVRRVGLYEDDAGQKAIRYERCYLPSEEIGGAKTWCDDDEKSARDKEINDCSSRTDPEICSCLYSKRSKGTILTVEYETGPDAFTTLGAAFGYATFIELIVTVVIVSFFSMCGIIKKDDAYIKLIVNQALKEHGTAKKVAGETGVTSDSLGVTVAMPA